LEPRDSGWGVTVLEHRELNDRVAIARKPDGRWIFAAVPDYEPRANGESPADAFARLHRAIQRSPSTGEGQVAFTSHVKRAIHDRALTMRGAPATDRAGARNYRAIERSPSTGEVQIAFTSMRGAPATDRAGARNSPEFDVQHLGDFATRAGYEPRHYDSGNGIAVFEHPRLQDRIAIAKVDGRWMFAAVPDYEPRVQYESVGPALWRLHDAIQYSPAAGIGCLAFDERTKDLQRNVRPALADARSDLHKRLPTPHRGPDLGR